MLTFSFEQRLFFIGLLTAASLVIYGVTVPESEPAPWRSRTMAQTAVLPSFPDPLDVDSKESPVDVGTEPRARSTPGQDSGAPGLDQQSSVQHVDARITGSDFAANKTDATGTTCTRSSPDTASSAPPSSTDDAFDNESVALAHAERRCTGEGSTDTSTNSPVSDHRRNASRDQRSKPHSENPARVIGPTSRGPSIHGPAVRGPSVHLPDHDRSDATLRPATQLQARAFPSLEEGIDDLNDMFASAYWILVLGGLAGMILGSDDNDSESSSVSSFLRRILSPSAPRFFTRKTKDGDEKPQQPPASAAANTAATDPDAAGTESEEGTRASAPGQRPKLFAGMNTRKKNQRLFDPEKVPVYDPSETSNTSDDPSRASEGPPRTAPSAPEASGTPALRPTGNRRYRVTRVVDHIAAVHSPSISDGAHAHADEALGAQDNDDFVDRSGTPTHPHVPGRDQASATGSPSANPRPARSPLGAGPHPSRPPQRRSSDNAQRSDADPKHSDASGDHGAPDDRGALDDHGAGDCEPSQRNKSAGFVFGGTSFPTGLGGLTLPSDSNSSLKRRTYSGIHTDGPFPEINDLRAWREIERLGAKQAYMRVTSDVMDPEITRGSVVSLRPSDVFAGESVYAFRMWEAFYVARLLRLPENRVRVLPANPVYQPFVLNLATQDVELKGRVTGLFL